MSENLHKATDVDSSNFKTSRVFWAVSIIFLLVVGSYGFNFHTGLSDKNEIWGTFGDYFGGILNPVIAGFALYLIAETYKLQKRELEATRCLLKISTDAQEKQIKLAALTALINSDLIRVNLLKLEMDDLLKKTDLNSEEIEREFAVSKDNSLHDDYLQGVCDGYPEMKKINENQKEIRKLTNRITKLENQIEAFLK